MKKLVIFDLDGTLLNTIADLGHATNEALTKGGFSTHPIDAYPNMVGNGVRKLIERALPAECRTDATVQRLLGDFKAYYDAHLTDFTQPYAGIVELLNELASREIAIAVASNKYESAVKRLVNHFFPEIDFAAICGNVEGVPTKPDPSIVFRVLSEHPTPKSQVLYVGDSGVDMETARRACVDSCGVTWGFRPERELTAAYADNIINQPDQILDLV